MRKRYKFNLKAMKAGAVFEGELAVFSDMKPSAVIRKVQEFAAEKLNSKEESIKNNIVFTPDDIEIVNLNIEIDLESLLVEAMNQRNAEAFPNAINDSRNRK